MSGLIKAAKFVFGDVDREFIIAPLPSLDLITDDPPTIQTTRLGTY